MLRLKLVLPRSEDLCAWTSKDGAWAAGPSFLEPYPHRMIEAAAYRCGDRMAFVVRERNGSAHRTESVAPVQSVDEPTWSAALAEASTWPLNVISVVLNYRSHTVTIRSGAWGTAPLYTVNRDQTLWADWDAARLYPHLRGNLDPVRSVYSAVHMGYPYARQTVVEEMTHLTERSVAVWDADRTRLAVQYPDPVPRLKPTQLREGADVAGAFASVLESIVALWTGSDAPAATELSGGLDSAAVAVALSARVPAPVRSYGLIVPGVSRASQIERRDELIHRFGLRDCALPAALHLPFAPDGQRIRDHSMIAWSELYHDAVAALYSNVHDDGVDVIFSGVGGDELSTLMRIEEPNDDSEDQGSGDSTLPPFLTPRGIEAYHAAADDLDLAPRPATETSCVESAAAGTDVCLRAGLWPAYPYCHPEIVNFCRSLPAEWRRDRMFQRRYLERAGCSPRMVRPAIAETFLDLMTMAIARHTGFIETLLRESRLAQQGFIDVERLLHLYAHVNAATDEQWMDSLIEVATLELTARSIEKAQLAGGTATPPCGPSL